MAVVAVRQPFSLPPLLRPKFPVKPHYGAPPIVGAKAAVFPAANAPLDVRVYIAFGADLSASSGSWGWTEVTNFARVVEGIDITYGRADESSQAQPASCKLTLNNPNGDYTAFNPNSIYYPYVRRNTPIKVTVNPDTVRHRGPQIRFFGYLSTSKPGWDVSTRMPTVSVEAHGILRRLNQGTTPVKSALYRRTILGAKHYWPAEDGPESTQIVEVTGSGRSLLYTGDVSFQQGSPPAGSQPVLSLGSGAVVHGEISFTSTNSWSVAYLLNLPASVAGDSVIAQWQTTGTYATMRHTITQNYAASKDYLRLQGFDSTGAMTLDDAIPFDVGDTIIQAYGEWVYITIAFGQVGSQISYEHAIDSGDTDDGTFGSGFLAATTGGVPTSLRFAGAGAMVDAGLGQISVWDRSIYTADDIALIKPLIGGYDGETAVARLVRLCGEQGVPITVANSSSTTTMGKQRQATFLSLLRECEAADGGVLSDGQNTGLSYNPRSGRYNPAVSFTADMSAAQVAPPFVPIDDDQRVRNEWTVKRTNGSEGHAIDEDGPLGTLAVGVYDSSVTINVETDTNLGNEAAWRVHLGTVEGLRYPTLALNLHSPGGSLLIDDWLDASAGSRVDVTNVTDVLTQHPPGTVSLLIEGYTETLRPFDWDIVANCSPVAPWRVGVVADAALGRLDTGGSDLATAATTTAASLSVATTGTKLWTTTVTYPNDFPLDVDIGGEQVTVTAISGTSSPQTFTVTRSVNGVVKAHAAGAAVSLWMPAVIAL